MPEISGRELLREWQRAMETIVGSLATVAGKTEVPRQLLEPMQRQLELVQDLTDRVLAPVDAVFELLEQTGGTLRHQAEALEAAGRALEETSALMKVQAEMFERTIGAARHPARLVKAARGTPPPG